MPIAQLPEAGCDGGCAAAAAPNISANGLPSPKRSSDALLGAAAPSCESAAPNKSTILVFACAAGGDDKNGLFAMAVGDPSFCYKKKEIKFRDTEAMLNSVPCTDSWQLLLLPMPEPLARRQSRHLNGNQIWMMRPPYQMKS